MMRGEHRADEMAESACCGSPTDRLMTGLPGSMPAMRSFSRTKGERRFGAAWAGASRLALGGHRCMGIRSDGRATMPAAQGLSHIRRGEVKTRLTIERRTGHPGRAPPFRSSSPRDARESVIQIRNSALFHRFRARSFGPSRNDDCPRNKRGPGSCEPGPQRKGRCRVSAPTASSLRMAPDSPKAMRVTTERSRRAARCRGLPLRRLPTTRRPIDRLDDVEDDRRRRSPCR